MAAARILIVEDDQIIAADLRLKVERLGHEVIGIASAGEEAVGIADRLQPEIVFMDIQLEGTMRGTEAARVIQERADASIIFVTAFSGAAFRDDDGRISDRGIYLGKPFSQIQLEEALNTALRKRSQS